MTQLQSPQSFSETVSAVRLPINFTDTELKALAANASTLSERLANRGDYTPRDDSPSQAEKAFAAWQHNVAGGDTGATSKVEELRGVDPTKDVPLFGPVDFAGTAVPGWVETFEWAFAAMQRAPTEDQIERFAGDTKGSYGVLFFPLADEARRRRDAAAGQAALKAFTPAALDNLDCALIKQLADICLRALNDRLSLTLQTENAGGFLAISNQSAVEDRVPGFIESLRGPQLAQFFNDRPVLARLLATALEQWQSATLEFVERFHNDHQVALQQLIGSSDRGRVKSIGASLSDLHNNGRSVYQVTFEDGTKIGYKPKSLDIDAAWAEFLAWLHADGAPLSAGAPKVVCRGDYGWVEWVAAKDCDTAEEADEFFYRSGATLCLIRILQGNDFHFENTVACGPVPVPIDLETIMVARQKVVEDIEPEAEAFTKACHKLENSVFMTGYLPGWTSVPGGAAVILGGLDAHESLTARANGSTDVPHKGNVPRLNGTRLRLNDYSDTLLEGYRDMFNYLARRGAVITAPDGPLEFFSGLRFRAVLRATRLYGYLQQRALGRRCVGDGVAWSQNFDFLYRSSVTTDRVTPLAQLCSYETDCMIGYNVPFFEGETDSTHLICGDGTIVPDYFHETCMVDIRHRLTNMDTGLLDFDLFVIQQSLSTTDLAAPSVGHVASADEPATDAEMIAAAEGLAARVEKSAIHADASKTWLCPTPVTADERAVQLQPLTNGFLTGTMGIAVFNAALFKVTGNEAYRRAASIELASILSSTEKLEACKAIATVTPLGLASGNGGIVFGLIQLATLLGDQNLLAKAEQYASFIDIARFNASEDASIANGMAGALIAIMALYQHRPKPEYRAFIASGAQNLMEARVRTSEFGKCWRDKTWRVPQIGLMHGASGIALALSRAGQIVDDPALFDAARDALTFEASIYELFGYWPDLRDITEIKCDAEGIPAHCYSNGASGIGIARLAMSDWIDPTKFDNCYSSAIKQVYDDGPIDADGVFTGRFGRLAFLYEHALQNDDHDLIGKVGRETRTVLQDADNRSSFSWRIGDDGQNPTLFDGSAGVGMCLLRMARPDLVPNLWEFPS